MIVLLAALLAGKTGTTVCRSEEENCSEGSVPMQERNGGICFFVV
jgi:hypothetical protein